MNASQHHAMDTLAGHYLLEVPRDELTTSVRRGCHLDLEQAFGRRAPLAIEIGSGVGDSLTAMSVVRPEFNVLAFEVYAPAIASTMGKLDRAGARNVRLISADGAEGLRELIAPGTLAELWTFFPDPWPKKRHHKRRLVQPEFAALVASRLVEGGAWRMATDWASYAEQMHRVCDGTPGLVNAYADHPGGWAPRPDRPVTRFERRGLDAGRTVRDLVYRRAASR
ncbi:tRNA (guanosine(46)-N7)-methyltransferase TrmB [Propionibacterium sp.]|uniref:tRNA (guanosine(46)-N7)-methyltransferase TrmB n=1 Tax=Propionibacterium sp. TaxID=1977903 RepID=UPI0039E7549C